MEEEELKEQIKVIKEKLNGQKLFIQRVPKNTFLWFKEFANDEEFCGDYGFALKHLCDFYKGIIESGIDHLEMEVISLKERLDNLEKKPEEKKTRTMMDGKKVEVKKK